jgi:threonine/homoserine/homoserine lactone efflux protein
MTITSLAIFALALLPDLIALESVTALGYLELVAVTVAVLALVDGGYVLMASRIGRLLRRPAALRWVRRGCGALLAGAAVAVASR